MTTRTTSASLVVGAATLSLVLSAQQATFRSSVAAIVVPASVTDKNRPVPNLKASDFEVRDNGVKQDVALATVDRLPVDVTLMIDTSGSISGRALEQIKADIQEMSDLLQPNDRVRLLTFGKAPRDVFGLREGGARLPVDQIEAGGPTSVYDSLGLALVAYPYVDRPQLLFVVTDGRDNSSFADADTMSAAAGQSEALLCIALVSPADAALRGGADAPFNPRAEQSTVTLSTMGNLPPGASVSRLENTAATSSAARSMGLYYGGPNLVALRAAAAATGGAVFQDPGGESIPALFRRVLDDFRASYLLSYTPQGVAAGGWHTIAVTMKNSRYSVRARKGYDGGAQDDAHATSVVRRPARD